MKQFHETLRNENGSAIIYALLTLVVLTIIGISATNTSEVELKIAGNDKLFRAALYSAESGLYGTAKLVSTIVDDNEVPEGKPNGFTYEDETDDDLIGEVMGYPGAYDESKDLSFTMGGGGEVKLDEASVGVDLQRYRQRQPAGGATEFGVGTEGNGIKPVIEIPYGLLSDGTGETGTSASVMSVYIKLLNVLGGI